MHRIQIYSVAFDRYHVRLNRTVNYRKIQCKTKNEISEEKTILTMHHHDSEASNQKIGLPAYSYNLNTEGVSRSSILFAEIETLTQMRDIATAS